MEAYGGEKLLHDMEHATGGTSEDEQHIGLIRACISSVSYKVSVNGKKTNTITSLRGLRQGDPYPPYIFILIVNVLSHQVKDTCLNR